MFSAEDRRRGWGAPAVPLGTPQGSVWARLPGLPGSSQGWQPWRGRDVAHAHLQDVGEDSVVLRTAAESGPCQGGVPAPDLCGTSDISVFENRPPGMAEPAEAVRPGTLPPCRLRVEAGLGWPHSHPASP